MLETHTPPGLFTCTRCGADSGRRLRDCLACGGRDTLAAIPASRRGQPYGSSGYRPAARKRPATASLPDLLAGFSTPRLYGWGYAALRLPANARVSIDGRPGQGKSTVTSVMALALAHAGLPVLVVSAEEGQVATAMVRWARCCQLVGLPRAPAQLWLADARTPEEASAEVDAFASEYRRGVVVIDSTTEVGGSPAWLAGLLADAALGFVLVQHVTTSGAPRGGWEVAHAVDVRVSCQALVASIEKSRFGECTNFPVLEPEPLAPASPGTVIDFPGTRP